MLTPFLFIRKRDVALNPAFHSFFFLFRLFNNQAPIASMGSIVSPVSQLHFISKFIGLSRKLEMQRNAWSWHQVGIQLASAANRLVTNHWTFLRFCVV